MPPRRSVAAGGARRKEENNFKVPVKKGRMVPRTQILTDAMERMWTIGKSIAVAGFEEIYLATNGVFFPVSDDDARYIVKVGPHSNRPLHVEMRFYQHVAKNEMIRAWQAQKRLDFLGMPKFIACGNSLLNGNVYRFMVMERFGDDIHKLFLKHNKCFSLKTVVILARKIIDVLEFIHEAGYTHSDIKGSNLLLGFGPGRENEVYLVDFGLASLYAVEGKHKAFKEDPISAHSGTIEFTSRDAHMGVTSRRSDMEILAYNMIYWLAGKLPWEENLQNVKRVHQEKMLFMTKYNIAYALKKFFGNKSVPGVLEQFLDYVANLEFAEQPDYSHCKKILQLGLHKMGIIDDGKLDLYSPQKVQFTPSTMPSCENNIPQFTPRKTRAATRKSSGLPEKPRNFNTMGTKLPVEILVPETPSPPPQPLREAHNVPLWNADADGEHHPCSIICSCGVPVLLS